MPTNETLIIIPCGAQKIWARRPGLGPVPAKDAYTSAAFGLNRRYAETFGSSYLILSARQGFLNPDDLIEDYNVTFKKASTGPVAVDTLRRQVREMNLDRFELVIGIGGAEYRAAIAGAFADTKVMFPFAGLSLGLTMRAVKRALESGEPMTTG